MEQIDRVNVEKGVGSMLEFLQGSSAFEVMPLPLSPFSHTQTRKAKQNSKLKRMTHLLPTQSFEHLIIAFKRDINVTINY